MKLTTVIAVLIVIAAVAAGWWWMQNGGLPSSQPAVQSAPSGGQDPYAYAPGNLLLGADSTTTVGAYLIASNAMTLYTFSRDASNTSTCTGLCAKTWPPYTIPSRDVLANVQAGINGKVDAITRDDGSLQVTYDGQPLYFYVNDKVSGDLTGQGVGNVWFIVKP